MPFVPVPLLLISLVLTSRMPEAISSQQPSVVDRVPVLRISVPPCVDHPGAVLAELELC